MIGLIIFAFLEGLIAIAGLVCLVYLNVDSFRSKGNEMFSKRERFLWKGYALVLDVLAILMTVGIVLGLLGI